MPKIMSYIIERDKHTSYTLTHPDYMISDQGRVSELCTIDDLTYVSVPDGAILPMQSTQVQKTLKEIVLSEELRDKIKVASVHYKLIEERLNDILPIMKPEDGRYFMLSFDSVKMDAEKVKYGIADVLNVKEALKPHIKNTAGYVQEIEQWGSDRKGCLGLDAAKK
jgi:hypothetical protein